jgi:ABC-type glycerol-3-phosphate transport system substrate-binding protein
MPVGRKGKMKTLALIALVMALGLSGCASNGMTELIRQDWIRYWGNPGGASWESLKQDWTVYWENPEGASWESLKLGWTAHWGNP